MWAHPGKQLLFMGGEFGQRDEWSDSGLEWQVLDYPVHQGVQQLSRDLNAIYRRTPALWELDTSPEGFSWIDANDARATCCPSSASRRCPRRRLKKAPGSGRCGPG